jgi:hypothetical protein
MSQQRFQSRSTRRVRPQHYPFPLSHRGDPDPRRMVLASIGFQWRAGLWRRSRVALSDADIDAMEARTRAQCLRRWTRRRPRAQE